MSWAEDNWLHFRFRYLNRQLRDFELRAPDPEDLLPLTEEDVRDDLSSHSNPYFLEFFSRRGLVKLGLQFNLVDRLREMGFEPHMRIVPTEPPHHMLRVYDKIEAPENLLIELALHRETTLAKAHLNLPDGTYQFLFVDWMLLQNPREGFTPDRPRLPGQQYPGLRLGLHVAEILMLVAERLKQDGLLTFPNHYHNGVLYGRKMSFVNPIYQGHLHALQRDLHELSLAEQSWAVELGCVEDEQGAVYKWTGAEMMLVQNPKLQDYQKSKHYQALVRDTMKEHRFHLDRERFQRLYQPA
jgi:hypothetical protein